MYEEDDLLALSGIQHFAFCRRQWALIHVEQQWAENVHTVLGDLLHGRAHDEAVRERRGELLVVRGLGVRSLALGLSGICDVVEFRQSPDGVPLAREEGLWRAAPVEYKKGRKKSIDADRLQLCAQAMCLEEMLCTDIPEAFLYYGATHSRERVVLGKALREEVREAAKAMHDLFHRGQTPQVRPTKACAACSLKEICLPELTARETVAAYYARHLRS